MTVSSTGQGPSTVQRAWVRRGFTLTELLVVIAIVVILLGISVSIGKSLQEGNRLLTCKAQMQQIGQALRMYEMDEKSVPPFYITTDQDPDADAPSGPGLKALYDTGYLTRELTLHCPRDVETFSGNADFLNSYQRKWEHVGAEYELNRYSYLPFRGVTDPSNTYYRKQLAPGAVPPGGSSAVPYVDVDWHPADDTVVLWCGFHADTVSMNGEGQYLVLFWDGSVKKIARSIMEDATPGAEAWKVTPSQATD